jgi:hypothetical protein
VRRLRRRRPAGEPQVPIEVVEPFVLAPVVGPAVVRIGPDGTLLDAPWEMSGCSIAHIWPDDRVAGGWARVEWPVDAPSLRPIAPLDLHLGHMLEIRAQRGDGGRPIYAIVADVDPQRLILVSAGSAAMALAMHHNAVDTWRCAELFATAELWRERFAGPAGR